MSFQTFECRRNLSGICMYKLCQYRNDIKSQMFNIVIFSLYCFSDPKLWTHEHVVFWLRDLARKHNFHIDTERFLMNGKGLCFMTLEGFRLVTPVSFSGYILLNLNPIDRKWFKTTKQLLKVTLKRHLTLPLSLTGYCSNIKSNYVS